MDDRVGALLRAGRFSGVVHCTPRPRHAITLTDGGRSPPVRVRDDYAGQRIEASLNVSTNLDCFSLRRQTRWPPWVHVEHLTTGYPELLSYPRTVLRLRDELTLLTEFLGGLLVESEKRQNRAKRISC